jgi:hypothetical protein
LIHTEAMTEVIVDDPNRLSREPAHQLPLAEDFERAAVTPAPTPGGGMGFGGRGGAHRLAGGRHHAQQ